MRTIHAHGANFQRRYWERWNEDNRPAIEAYNARIAEEGLPLARYRGFCRGARRVGRTLLIS